MTELASWPAHAIATAVRRRELSPVDVVTQALDRVARLDPAINAFCALRADAAVAEARALAERIARGEDPGLLAGVPFGVKDEQDVAGMATTYGSVPFRDHVAQHDSTLVARLRREGAIPIGKTNMPEFGSTAFTKNRLFGVTRNPWDLDRTPGGSSGGSSAAVAAGLVPLATGGDGGGSIRIPASYTGLVGLKATFGRVPRGPFMFRDWVDTVCRGPLTRSVLDAALFLDAVVGHDPHDPDSLPHPGHAYRDRLDEAPHGLRVAYSATLGYARVAPDVRRAVERAVDTLGRALAVPVEPIADRITDGGMAWAMLNCFEQHAKLAPIIERHRDEWGRGYLRGVDHGGRLGAADIGRFQQERLRVIEDVAAVFARYDVLLTPTVPTTAFPAGGPMPGVIDGAPIESPLHAVAFSYPFNLTGHPACSMPIGVADDGLPVGLQIVTQRHRDDLLLQVARAVERAIPVPPPPPPAH
ncbi:MAG TPA: amidase [Candidatus Binatia bacterium]|nr:amidase [Candidatus Binatia bacterium]